MKKQASEQRFSFSGKCHCVVRVMEDDIPDTVSHPRRTASLATLL